MLIIIIIKILEVDCLEKVGSSDVVKNKWVNIC